MELNKIMRLQGDHTHGFLLIQWESSEYSWINDHAHPSVTTLDHMAHLNNNVYPLTI